MSLSPIKCSAMGLSIWYSSLALCRTLSIGGRPPITRFMQRLASFSRLILFDKRETGLSDRVAGIATLEERMDDVRAVMDAVGSEQAAVFGISEGGPMSILFAATYPKRTSALVVYGSFPEFSYWIPTPEALEQLLTMIEQGRGTCCTLPFLRRASLRTRSSGTGGHALSARAPVQAR
jgi:pimeloyl-ACP methyl ester carboxylesterase